MKLQLQVMQPVCSVALSTKAWSFDNPLPPSPVVFALYLRFIGGTFQLGIESEGSCCWSCVSHPSFALVERNSQSNTATPPQRELKPKWFGASLLFSLRFSNGFHLFAWHLSDLSGLVGLVLCLVGLFISTRGNWSASFGSGAQSSQRQLAGELRAELATDHGHPTVSLPWRSRN